LWRLVAPGGARARWPRALRPVALAARLRSHASYSYDNYDYDDDYDNDNDNDYNYDYVRQGRAGRRTVDCPYYPFYLCYPPALYTERVIEYVIECVIE
jgi:hypothetical protein